MADIEGMLDSMGISFFCNAMVEGLYYFRKDGSMFEKLKQNCKIGIAELESLKWPLVEKTFPEIKTGLFRTNKNIHTFERVCEYEERPTGEVIDGLIGDLKYILSNKPRGEKLETARKLQSFFDNFGDYSFYATRDCMRC